MKTENFVPENINRIGVLSSGGLDSSLLLYLIANEIKTSGRDVEVVALTIKRKNAMDHATRVVDYIEQTTGTKIKRMNVGDPQSSSAYQVITGMWDALFVNKFPLVFLATTAIPDVSLEDGFDAPMRNTTPFPGLHQPWCHETKDNVVKYIVENSLMDLAKLTHSCTVEDLTHCGKCFNCVERQWAFDTNNAENVVDF
jgi:7-cyano-7-deazaguanine synthase in queuosine biosynthesis